MRGHLPRENYRKPEEARCHHLKHIVDISSFYKHMRYFKCTMASKQASPLILKVSMNSLKRVLNPARSSVINWIHRFLTAKILRSTMTQCRLNNLYSYPLDRFYSL